MRRTTRQHLAPTSRDTALFSYLYQNKVATAEQIQRDVVKFASICNCLRRIRHLKEAGFICRCGITEDRKSAYGLSKKGVRFLEANGPIKVSQAAKSYDAITLNHDLALVDIVAIARHTPGTSDVVYESEIRARLIKPEFQKIFGDETKIPDLALIVRIGNQNRLYVFEYQKKMNDESRWNTKLLHYYSRPEIVKVLLLTDKTDVTNRFLSLDSQLFEGHERKLHATELSEFRKYGLSTDFRSSVDSRFSLNRPGSSSIATIDDNMRTI